MIAKFIRRLDTNFSYHMQQQNAYKVVFVGASHTGKSSLIQRYINNQFSVHTVPSVQSAFFQKIENINDKEVCFDIWDTAGQERFHSLAPVYYRDANVAIIVFDLTDAGSYTKAKQWLHELRDVHQDKIYMILVGNKCDLQSIIVIPEEEILNFAQANNVHYIEASAKTNFNILTIFQDAALEMIARQEQEERENEANRVQLQSNNKPSGCCH